MIIKALVCGPAAVGLCLWLWWKRKRYLPWLKNYKGLIKKERLKEARRSRLVYGVGLSLFLVAGAVLYGLTLLLFRLDLTPGGFWGLARSGWLSGALFMSFVLGGSLSGVSGMLIALFVWPSQIDEEEIEAAIQAIK